MFSGWLPPLHEPKTRILVLIKHIQQISLIFPVPGDAVKGKTWGPSTASAHVKQRPTIVPEREQARWKATSAPSLEKSPRNLVNVPSVGTVPEGEKSIREQLLVVLEKNAKIMIVFSRKQLMRKWSISTLLSQNTVFSISQLGYCHRDCPWDFHVSS